MTDDIPAEAERTEEEFLRHCTERQKTGPHGEPKYGGPCSQRVERCIQCVIEEAVITLRRVEQERDAAKAEAARNILRHTARGYAAGESDNGKAWRKRAEAAEAKLQQVEQERDTIRVQLRDRAEAAEAKLIQAERKLTNIEVSSEIRKLKDRLNDHGRD